VSWRGFADMVKGGGLVLRIADRLGRGRGRFRWLDRLHHAAPAPLRPDLRRWEGHELAAVWVGHGTVLLRTGGRTLLIDPVFSRRIGLGAGLLTLGVGRLVEPALSIGQLPRLDAILITHAHFDHLDCPSLWRLPKDVPVLVAEGNGDLVRGAGFRDVREMRWEQSEDIGGVRVTAKPVRHWGARVFFDRHRGYCGFLIESGRRRVFHAGDTAMYEPGAELRGVDLAVFSISAYDPYIQAHATPEQVWQMTCALRAGALLPVHHSTFILSHEPPGEPLERLLEAAGPESRRIVVRETGGMWAGT